MKIRYVKYILVGYLNVKARFFVLFLFVLFLLFSFFLRSDFKGSKEKKWKLQATEILLKETQVNCRIYMHKNWIKSNVSSCVKKKKARPLLHWEISDFTDYIIM